jgi:hypothetical protein
MKRLLYFLGSGPIDSCGIVSLTRLPPFTPGRVLVIIPLAEIIIKRNGSLNRVITK